MGKDPDQRDEEDTLPGHGEEGGGNGAADGLQHHVAHDDPALEAEGHALEAQGRGTDGNDLRIIPEQGNQIRCKNQAEYADDSQKNERYGTKASYIKSVGIWK